MTLRRAAFAPLARFWYLALTPVFALLDDAFGIDLRVSLLDAHPTLRGGYCVASFLCGVGAALWPYGARAIALAESGANLAVSLARGYVAWVRGAGALGLAPRGRADQ